MNKCLLVALLIMGLTSCSAKDEQYYRTHPKIVQQVIKECPEKQPKGITCQKLQEIATHLNELAYKLQYNPQEFGNTILKLQQTIATDNEQLKQSKDNTQLLTAIDNNKKELAEHLAIVKWLESPES